MRLRNFFLWNNVKLREVRKDDSGGFTKPGDKGGVVNLESAQNAAVRIETHQGINEVIDSLLDIGEGWQGGEGRGHFLCLNGECAIPCARNEIAGIESVPGLFGFDQKRGVLNGHTGEGAVEEGDETTANPAVDKVNGRFAGNRVDDVCTNIDLIKRDARCRDSGSAACFPPENDEANKDICAVY